MSVKLLEVEQVDLGQPDLFVRSIKSFNLINQNLSLGYSCLAPVMSSRSIRISPVDSTCATNFQLQNRTDCSAATVHACVLKRGSPASLCVKMSLLYFQQTQAFLESADTNRLPAARKWTENALKRAKV